MRPKQAIRQVSRAISVLAKNGPRQFLGKLLTKLRDKVGLSSAGQQRWIQQKSVVDTSFDEQWGSDTGGIQRLHSLTIDAGAAKYGTSHIASDPREFAAALEAVDEPLEGFTFIDLGSGKGRALLLASAYPFTRIIGVEFARELHQVAVVNVERLVSADPSAARIEPVCADASTYVFPEEPLVLFLFHPFDSPIMRKVARNALKSWRAKPRAMRVVYVNPIYLDDWLDQGWVVAAQQHYHAVLRPAAGN